MQELGLYDIHCHIVPGVDDGAVNLEEAVKMVEAQYKQGIRTIIATPHFRKGMFEPSASEVKKQFQILRKTVWEINKDMRLYLGSELYASENMISQIKDKRADVYKRQGHEIVDSEEEAEVIVINTCCFIHDAKEESIENILEMAEYKKAGTCKVLIVTGCMAQRYKEEIIEEIPEVDAVLGLSLIHIYFRAFMVSRNGLELFSAYCCEASFISEISGWAIRE